MSINKILIIAFLGVSCCQSGSAASWTELFSGTNSNQTAAQSNRSPSNAPASTAISNAVDAGPLFSRVPLTLAPGERTEILGPLYYSEKSGTTSIVGFPPFMADLMDSATGTEEFTFLYPLVTGYRFGHEYRFQFLQFVSGAGGQSPTNGDVHRATGFPFYFEQRSSDSSNNYRAIFPIYGHLRNRLFRDEIDFIAWPSYVRTRKRDVINYDMPYPFYNKHYGNGLFGWEIWPFYGHEHKEITWTTNVLHEREINGGRESVFINWPIYMKLTNGIGTTNVSTQKIVIPLHTTFRSNLRDSTSWGWPIGVTHTIDREKQYIEWDTPWPIIEFARGEGKTENRVFPFFSQAHSKIQTDNWYAWPIYKYNRIDSPPLYRERKRICFFLYDDIITKATDTGRNMRRVNFFPFYTWRKELNGNERLQVLALFEPFFLNNAKVERQYAPVYSLWREEKNPTRHAASQSVLWNLYRRETSPGTKKISFLFGLFQYQSNPEGTRLRLCYIPVSKASTGTTDKH